MMSASSSGHMEFGDHPKNTPTDKWEPPKNIVGLKGYRFANWGGIYSCQPELFFQPSTTDEIKEIIEYARTTGKRVKLIGEGKSSSTIMMTNDYMISMKNYNKILNVDTESYQVKAEAGVTLEQLHPCLHDYGLALTNVGAIPYLSLGGILSTAVHGTGENYGVLPTQVVAIELLTVSGEIIECSRERHTDIFLAACCHLGALGIILNVTIQCEPAFKLHLQTSAMGMGQLLSTLDDHVNSSDHFRFNYYPHTDSVVTFYTNRTKRDSYGSGPGWIWIHLIHHHILKLCYYIGSFFPVLIVLFNKLLYLLNSSDTTDIVGPSCQILHYDCPCKQDVSEWAIPRCNAVSALRDLRECLESRQVIVHGPIEVRFCQQDDILISPAYQTDICYINIIHFRTYGKFTPHTKYWSVFESIAKRYGGRPHWAKMHSVTGKEFVEMYPRFEDFLNIRRQLDPEGLLLNDYLNTVLSINK